MTHCMNCNCSLSTNRAIEEHLKYSHGILIQLATAHDHRAYCHVCHKHLGAPSEQGGGSGGCFTGSRKAMEKHLFEEHEIYMHEEAK